MTNVCWLSMHFVFAFLSLSHYKACKSCHYKITQFGCFNTTWMQRKEQHEKINLHTFHHMALQLWEPVHSASGQEKGTVNRNLINGHYTDGWSTFFVGILSFMNSASRQRTFQGAWIFKKPIPGILLWNTTRVWMFTYYSLWSHHWNMGQFMTCQNVWTTTINSACLVDIWK